MQSIKQLVSLLFILLLSISVIGFPPQAEAASHKTAYVEVSSNSLNVRSGAGEKYKVVGKLKVLYENPNDYPFISDGQYVGTLIDGSYTYHDLTFETITDYSSEEMTIQLLYDSGELYNKESILSIEFFYE